MTRIEQLRTKRGWTPAFLAVKAGISERTILNLERGATRPSYRSTQRLIAEALSVSVATIFNKQDGFPK